MELNPTHVGWVGLGWVEFFFTHHGGLGQKIPSTQQLTRLMHPYCLCLDFLPKSIAFHIILLIEVPLRLNHSLSLFSRQKKNTHTFKCVYFVNKKQWTLKPKKPKLYILKQPIPLSQYQHQH